MSKVSLICNYISIYISTSLNIILYMQSTRLTKCVVSDSSGNGPALLRHHQTRERKFFSLLLLLALLYSQVSRGIVYGMREGFLM